MNEDERYDYEERDENDSAVEHVAEEGRHTDAFLFSDRLHHEVRAIADIGVCAHEHGAQTDCNKEILLDVLTTKKGEHAIAGRLCE